MRFIGAIALLLMACAHVSAHERKNLGAVTLTIGWGDEPAFAGLKNFVELDVADPSGAPVADIGGALSVDVAFGEQRTTLPLRPIGRQPGKFRARIIPTRAGVYTFHITGTIKGQSIDTTSTCSETTFACVAEQAGVQFPVKDPSAGQIAERLNRTLPRADEAAGRAAIALYMSIGAAAAAGVALIAVFASRRNRTNG